MVEEVGLSAKLEIEVDTAQVDKQLDELVRKAKARSETIDSVLNKTVARAALPKERQKEMDDAYLKRGGNLNKYESANLKSSLNDLFDPERGVAMDSSMKGILDKLGMSDKLVPTSYSADVDASSVKNTEPTSTNDEVQAPSKQKYPVPNFAKMKSFDIMTGGGIGGSPPPENPKRNVGGFDAGEDDKGKLDDILKALKEGLQNVVSAIQETTTGIKSVYDKLDNINVSTGQETALPTTSTPANQEEKTDMGDLDSWVDNNKAITQMMSKMDSIVSMAEKAWKGGDTGPMTDLFNRLGESKSKGFKNTGISEGEYDMLQPRAQSSFDALVGPSKKSKSGGSNIMAPEGEKEENPYGFLKGILDMINPFGKAGGKGGQGGGQVAGGAAMAIGAVMEIGQKIFEGIMKMVELFSEASGIFRGVLKLLKIGFLNILRPLADALGLWLMPYVKKMALQTAKNYKDYKAGKLTLGEVTAKNISDTAGTFGEMMFDGLKVVAEWLIKAIFGVPKFIIKGQIEITKWLLKGYFNVATFIATKFIEGIVWLATKIIDFITKPFELLLKGIDKLVDAIPGKGNPNLSGDFTTAVNTFKLGIETWGSDLTEKMTDSNGEIQKGLDDVFSTASTMVDEGYSEMEQFALDFLNGRTPINDQINDLLEEMKAVGKAMVDVATTGKTDYDPYAHANDYMKDTETNMTAMRKYQQDNKMNRLMGDEVGAVGDIYITVQGNVNKDVDMKKAIKDGLDEYYRKAGSS